MGGSQGSQASQASQASEPLKPPRAGHSDGARRKFGAICLDDDPLGSTMSQRASCSESAEHISSTLLALVSMSVCRRRTRGPTLHVMSKTKLYHASLVPPTQRRSSQPWARRASGRHSALGRQVTRRMQAQSGRASGSASSPATKLARIRLD